MYGINQQEADDFLERVEEVSRKVHDIVNGNIDLKELEREESEEKRQKELEVLTNQRKEREKQEEENKKLINGIKGKGQGNNYNFFCHFCFREFKLESMTKCTVCGKDIWTKEKRHEDLKNKVEQLKDRKGKKAQNKARYEMWLKTEELVTNRTFRNYQKWDLYESDTDEEEKGEPIVPKDDPKFKALEMDLNESMKRRENEFKLADKLKTEGNEFFKKAYYKEAIEKYTLAIDTCRSMKVLYTNRAMAYLKIDEYSLAMEDCDKVIEYFEAFDEELISNIETYLKALLRKAQSLKGLKKYTEAIEILDTVDSISKKEHEIVQDRINNTILEDLFSIFINKEMKLLKFEIESEKSVFESIKICIINQDINNNKEKDEIKFQIDTFLNQLEDFNRNHGLNNPEINYLESPSNVFSINNFTKFKNTISKLSIYLKAKMEYVYAFLSQNGLDLIINFIINYNGKHNGFLKSENKEFKEMLDEHSSVVLDLIISIIDNDFKKEENNKIILVVNTLKFFTKLAEILINKEEISKKFKLSTLNKIFTVLERASHLESSRKRLSEVPKIELTIEKMFVSYDFFKTISENNLNECNNSNLLLQYNLYINSITFISNLLYSSNYFKEKVIKYQMKLKINNTQFTIFDYFLSMKESLIRQIINSLSKSNNISYNNNESLEEKVFLKNIYMVEVICSFLTNLTVDKDFRALMQSNKKVLEVTSLLIKLLGIKKLYGNFSVYADLYDKSFSLLLNLNFEEVLTQHYIDSELINALNNFFDIVVTNNLNILKENEIVFSTPLLRTVVMVHKYCKKDYNVVVYNNYSNFKTLLKLLIKLNLIRRINQDIEELILSNIKAIALILNHNSKQKNPFFIITQKSIIFDLITVKNIMWGELFTRCQHNKNIVNDVEGVVNPLSFIISYYNIFNSGLNDSNVKMILDNDDELKNVDDKLFDEKEENIKILINNCANGLNLTRKNSAILLAKIVKTSKKLEDIVRKNHGMDILINISSKLNL